MYRDSGVDIGCVALINVIMVSLSRNDTLFCRRIGSEILFHSISTLLTYPLSSRHKLPGKLFSDSAIPSSFRC